VLVIDINRDSAFNSDTGEGLGLESSLEHVAFESAASLPRMIDGDCVDLSEGFVIKIDNCDSDINSLGSSIGRPFNHFSHLIH
jgi:hypothetical protein